MSVWKAGTYTSAISSLVLAFHGTTLYLHPGLTSAYPRYVFALCSYTEMRALTKKEYPPSASEVFITSRNIRRSRFHTHFSPRSVIFLQIYPTTPGIVKADIQSATLHHPYAENSCLHELWISSDWRIFELITVNWSIDRSIAVFRKAFA